VVCGEGGAKSRLRRAKTTDDLESERWDQEMTGDLYIGDHICNRHHGTSQMVRQ
jgi:hypothetical protein